jgi:hypothetical protein
VEEGSIPNTSASSETTNWKEIILIGIAFGYPNYLLQNQCTGNFRRIEGSFDEGG